MRLRNRLIALGCAGRRGVGRQFLRWTSYSSNRSLARATAALSPRVAALRRATRPERECDPSRFETMPWTGSGWRWQADKLRRSGAPTAPCLRSAAGIFSRAMINRLNLLHADDVRWAAALLEKNQETRKL